jgi:hypothetical protein
MLRRLAVVACLFLAACTTTNTRLADSAHAGAKVLIVQPDIELSLLTVTGLSEARADWSKSARDNIRSELKAAANGKALTLRELDPAAVEEPKVSQLLRLNEAVGTSIQGFDYGLYKLPTKKGFNWTLGEGAQALGQAYDADYALFTFSRGAYSSGGRKAAMVGMAMLGVSLPMAQQTAFVSLVDLKTGRVVWYNFAVAGSDSDMRTPEGARTFTQALLKNAPL